MYGLSFCNRNEILRKGRQETKTLYASEMSEFLSAARPICERTDVHCFIASNAYDEGQRDLVSEYNEVLADAQEPHVSYIDLFFLGSLNPEEHNKGHISPLISVWVLQIILNVILPADQTPADQCPRPISFEDACFMSTTYQGCQGCACTDYEKEVKNGREMWECANARQCSFERLEEITKEAIAAALGGAGTGDGGKCDDLVFVAAPVSGSYVCVVRLSRKCRLCFSLCVSLLLQDLSHASAVDCAFVFSWVCVLVQKQTVCGRVCWCQRMREP